MIDQEYLGPDVLIIDADSFLYRICWKPKSKAQNISMMEELVSHVIRETNASDTYVFVKGKGNFRFGIAEDYKAHRTSNIDPDMKERIDELYLFCQEQYVQCDNAEADDFCSIYFNKAIEDGKTAVVAHIDKDLNMIPGLHYNFVTKKHYYVDTATAHAFLMTQILIGDPADNIKSIKGIGPAKAKKVLGGLRNNQMLDKVIDVWKEKQGSTWREDFVKCANLIYIRPREELLRELSFEELYSEFQWIGDSKPLPMIEATITRLSVPMTSSLSGLTRMNGLTLVEQ